MALIECPECGKMVSDKAPACPHCGYVIKKNKVKFKKSNIIKLVGAVIVVGAIGIIVFTHQSSVSGEQDIKIDRWELLEAGKYIDTYEGKISSSNKGTILAVIGKDDGIDESIISKFALLKDGSGKVEVYTDEDPSQACKVTGYLRGKEVTDKIVKNVKSEASDYDDYDESVGSSCNVKMTVELKEKTSGILFGEISLDVPDVEKEFCEIPIIDGEGEYSYGAYDLPYKMRGVDVKFEPEYFCKAEELTSKNYKVLKEFEIERGESSYGNINYSGSEELEIPDVNKGILMYVAKEKDSKDNGMRVVSIENSKCELSTYKYIDPDEEEDVKPEYQIDIKGYIEIGKVKEEKENE